MSTFNLSRDGHGPSVDLPTLIDTRLLIQANSGGGKSYALRRLLEQTFGKVQHLVIDVEGEFASLREQFDYLHVAKGGDTPANPRTASLLAERLLELKVSAILDIYELRHDARIAFVRDFLDSIVNAPKSLWHPVIIVIDEAHIFCPQSGDSESASAVIDLCTRGRKRGFCAVLATQRLSKLHKDAAAECINKLIGRTGLDIDVKRASDELGFNVKDGRSSLRKLDAGHFFAFGPAISTEVTEIQIGPVKTTHPKAGSSRVAFVAPPPTDKIRSVLEELANLPELVEHRKRTLHELEGENSRLRRELADRPQPKAVAPKIIEKPILKERDFRRLEQLEEKASARRTQLVSVLLKQREAMLDLTTLVGGAVQGLISPKTQGEEPATRGGTDLAGPKKAGAAVPNRQPQDTAGLPPGEYKALTVVAQHRDGIVPKQIDVLCQFKQSTRNLYLQRLTSKGLVEADRGLVFATDAGRAMLGPRLQELPKGQALQQIWFDRLPPGQVAILKIALRAHPRSVSKHEIQLETGMAVSTVNLYCQRMAASRVIKNEWGKIRAVDELV